MKIMISILFTLTFLPAFSQEEKEFYTEDGERTDSAGSFYYSLGVKEIISYGALKVERFVDSVKSYYTYTRTIKARQFHNEKGLPHGLYREYYPNGKKMEAGVYKSNHKIGLVTQWYANEKKRFDVKFPDEPPPTELQPEEFDIINYWDTLGNQLIKNGMGYCSCQFFSDVVESGKVVQGLKDSTWAATRNDTLRYTENYSKGEFKDGVSYYDGRQFPYQATRVQPEFVGGLPEMIRFIKGNMKYPREARRLGMAGTVYITFVVAKDGSLQDIKIRQGVADLLDEEALRVVSLMSRKWVPGKQRGLPVFVRFNLPIKFSLP